MTKQLGWDLYFLDMLELVKIRSPDAETKVACIITDNNRVCSTGFNGHFSGIDGLPVNRPDKYSYIIHSEINCLANLGWKPNNPVAYITHRPCLDCLKSLWQFNIRRIVIPKNAKVFSHSEDDDRILHLLKSNGLELVEIDISEPNIEKLELTGDFE